MMSTASSSIQSQLSRKTDLIVIGASAGGVAAMLYLFKVLPASFSIPIVALLHMPDNRDSNLAEVFQHWVAMRVKEAEDKESVLPGNLYFAPPGYHLSIEEERVFSLSCEPPINYSRPAIDILMESAAYAYGESLVGVLLTGANYDGAKGLMEIKKAGGITLVQDPNEAQSADMPREAINYQKPDYILSLGEIKNMLLELGEVNAR